jgi:hypothetical protein
MQTSPIPRQSGKMGYMNTTAKIVENAHRASRSPGRR